MPTKLEFLTTPECLFGASYCVCHSHCCCGALDSAVVSFEDCWWPGSMVSASGTLVRNTFLSHQVMHCPQPLLYLNALLWWLLIIATSIGRDWPGQLMNDCEARCIMHYLLLNSLHFASLGVSLGISPYIHHTKMHKTSGFCVPDG